MGEKPPVRAPAAGAQEAKEERLAAALRRNLARRKGKAPGEKAEDKE